MIDGFDVLDWWDFWITAVVEIQCFLVDLEIRDWFSELSMKKLIKIGGFISSSFQNSTTVWRNPTKIGRDIEYELLEDPSTCFLPGSVHKLCHIKVKCYIFDFWQFFHYAIMYGHSLEGSKSLGPQATHTQYLCQVWLDCVKRLRSSGSGKKRVHHFCLKFQDFKHPNILAHKFFLNSILPWATMGRKNAKFGQNFIKNSWILPISSQK